MEKLGLRVIMNADIHPTAVVSAGAKLAAGVTVVPYAVIGEEVVVGAGSEIGAHVTVEYTRMGKENKLFPGCHIGGPPQDYKYGGEQTLLILGDRNRIREAATLNRATSASGATRIGSNNLFMSYSHVGHDCVVGDHVILANSVGTAGHVEIGDHTFVGGLAGLHQFVRIGRNCMVAAGSMVSLDVPHFCTVQGDRAVLRGINVNGLRRSGFPRATIGLIKEAYRTLYESDLRLADAIEVVRSARPVQEVAEMLDFIQATKRGVLRPAGLRVAMREPFYI